MLLRENYTAEHILRLREETGADPSITQRVCCDGHTYQLIQGESSQQVASMDKLFMEALLVRASHFLA